MGLLHAKLALSPLSPLKYWSSPVYLFYIPINPGLCKYFLVKKDRKWKKPKPSSSARCGGEHYRLSVTERCLDNCSKRMLLFPFQ